MKLNSLFAAVLSIATVAALAIWLVVEHQSRQRLVEEHLALEAQLSRMAELSAENERLSNLFSQASAPQSLSAAESLELLRLRGEVAVLRPQIAGLESVRKENQQVRFTLENYLKNPNSKAATVPATADYWPRDSWTFTGYATPDAALQSVLWAANNGDLKTLVASTTGEIQKMVAADLDGKSADEASIKAMDEVFNIKSIHVLSREFQDADTAILTAQIEGRTETTTEKMVLIKTGNEWKLGAHDDSHEEVAVKAQ